MNPAGIVRVADSVLSRRIYKKPYGLPLVMAWVTGRCNLRCQMCDEWKKEDFSGELSTAEWGDVIRSAQKLGTIIFSITGGEPFMRKDLPELVRMVRSCGMGCHICTNGTLLTKKKVMELKAFPPSSISVSLDGLPDMHNELRGQECFGLAVSGIRNVRAFLPSKLGVNYTLSKKNFHQLKDVLALTKRMGVDRLNIQPIHTNLRHREKPHEAYNGLLLEKKDLPEFEREFSKFQRASKQKAISKSFLNGIPDYFHGKAKCQACHAGYISCAIDANGGVSACDDMPPVAYVRDMPLEKIWKSDEFHIQRRKVDRCHANCWDTTHANLNILLSPKTALAEIGTLYSIVKYHLS